MSMETKTETVLSPEDREHIAAELRHELMEVVKCDTPAARAVLEKTIARMLEQDSFIRFAQANKFWNYGKSQRVSETGAV